MIGQYAPSDAGAITLQRTLRAVGSIWIGAVLLLILLVAMAFAAAYEATHGAPAAQRRFYYTWWFESLLWLVAINTLAGLAARFPFSTRQVGFVLTHGGILLIFAGALITKWMGVSGQISLAEGRDATEFTLARHDALVVAASGSRRTAIPVGDWGKFDRATDFGPPLRLSAGDIVLDVLKYLPDSRWERRVTNDSATPHSAVEITLTTDATEQTDWVAAGQSARVGDVQIAFRELDADAFGRAETASATQPVSGAIVRIEWQGISLDLNAESPSRAISPVGNSGYSARVMRYFAHAVVGPDNQIINEPSRPLNPYAEVEITGLTGTEVRRVFARFPEFGALHGKGASEGPRVTLTGPADEAPLAPIELLSGPDGRLLARFSHAGARPVSTPVAIGATVDSPWPGVRLAVRRRFDRARAQWSLEPIEPARDRDAAPAVLVRATRDTVSSEIWLPKYSGRNVELGDRSYELGFGDATQSLGFSIALERFRIGNYPGTNRPRSFESHIRVNDPRSGATQSMIVSMNHPASFAGFNFYQSSYHQDDGKMSSVLSVSRDPGQPVVFAGYAVLVVGMIVVLGIRIAQRAPAAERCLTDSPGPPGVALPVSAVHIRREMPPGASAAAPREMQSPGVQRDAVAANPGGRRP